MPPKKRKATESEVVSSTNKRVARSSTRPSAPVAHESLSAKASNATPKTSHNSNSTVKKNPDKVEPKSDKINATHNAGNASLSSSTPANIETLLITSDLVKSPLTCALYPSSKASQTSAPTLIFTHGAGGTLSAPAVVNFCTGFASYLPVLVFQGSMNLGSRVKGFHACVQHLSDKGERKKGSGRLVLGGRSMGARAAVMAASDVLESSSKDTRIDVILVSYPLQGPKDVRDQILMDLPASVNVLFVIGDRDNMCPLDLLEGVRGKMKATSHLVVVRGADHGMHTKPAKVERERGEESGRIAAEWVDGKVLDDVVYIGEET
ncbi:Alpha/Beta hydrolase protein [Paraphoma chrysanthemicola]|uniref:Alpha/Beta hydrolase protein n=1 Tax=Paraphoma chrysanthemicola TaxID=798071 RepID=A0A8K0R818_9PLEO|nr:Alpha/Beta hydrolase protein [Paraphoma chrysanthemicola]